MLKVTVDGPIEPLIEKYGLKIIYKTPHGLGHRIFLVRGDVEKIKREKSQKEISAIAKEYRMSLRRNRTKEIPSPDATMEPNTLEGIFLKLATIEKNLSKLMRGLGEEYENA